MFLCRTATCLGVYDLICFVERKILLIEGITYDIVFYQCNAINDTHRKVKNFCSLMIIKTILSNLFAIFYFGITLL